MTTILNPTISRPKTKGLLRGRVLEYATQVPTPPPSVGPANTPERLMQLIERLHTAAAQLATVGGSIALRRYVVLASAELECKLQQIRGLRRLGQDVQAYAHAEELGVALLDDDGLWADVARELV